VLTLDNAAADLVVGGAGAEMLGGAAATGADVVYAGSGAQVLVGGAGTSLLVANSGADTLAGGSGLTLFSFQNGRGGGSEVVTGWDATHDSIQLAGFGGPTAGLAAIAQVGADSMVTLTDGTQIRFVGVAGLSTASFI
jgi:Ca2+-binding RTX toxin-like protein